MAGPHRKVRPGQSDRKPAATSSLTDVNLDPDEVSGMATERVAVVTPGTRFRVADVRACLVEGNE